MRSRAFILQLVELSQFQLGKETDKNRKETDSRMF